MCLVLAIPKGNFMENKGDSRVSQITHKGRGGRGGEAALLWGLCYPHWGKLLSDYWFTAQNGWNISRIKLINLPLSWKCNCNQWLFYWIIVTEHLLQQMPVAIEGIITKTKHEVQVCKCEDKVEHGGKWNGQICWNEGTKIKSQNTNSGAADIPVTFGVLVAFRKIYEAVARFMASYEARFS